MRDLGFLCLWVNECHITFILLSVKNKQRKGVNSLMQGTKMFSLASCKKSHLRGHIKAAASPTWHDNPISFEE
jgi:hypothetical protein